MERIILLPCASRYRRICSQDNCSLDTSHSWTLWNSDTNKKGTVYILMLDLFGLMRKMLIFLAMAQSITSSVNVAQRTPLLK